jgi:hypothetical protein
MGHYVSFSLKTNFCIQRWDLHSFAILCRMDFMSFIKQPFNSKRLFRFFKSFLSLYIIWWNRQNNKCLVFIAPNHHFNDDKKQRCFSLATTTTLSSNVHQKSLVVVFFSFAVSSPPPPHLLINNIVSCVSIRNGATVHAIERHNDLFLMLYLFCLLTVIGCLA